MSASNCSPNWRRLGHAQSPIVERVLTKKKNLGEAHRSLPWMLANLAGAILTWLEREYGLLLGNHLDFLPFRAGILGAVVGVLAFNALVDLIRFARPVFSAGAAIQLTDAERKLLGVRPKEAAFRAATPSPPVTPDGRSVGIAARPPSPFRPTAATSSLNQSLLNVSSGSAGACSTPGGGVSPSPDTSLTLRRTSKVVSMDESISDHESLQEYLKDFEANERRKRFSLTEASPISGANASFWALNRGANASIAESAASLRKYQYQLSSKSPTTTKSLGSCDDPDNPNAVAAHDVWVRYDVSDGDLMHWTMNLRNWISESIVSPLVKEIDSKNEKLRRTGHGDSLIGEVGLHTLKRLAALDGSLDLNLMVQYLEAHENQEYLVKRFRTLAKGGCMSAFNANGGDSFKDKPWNEALPTDAALVLHIFATYLDSHLPFTSLYPDLKAFTRQYVIKSPEKPNLSKKDNIALYQSSLIPPVFKVVIGETVYDVAKGHNNLFHSIVLFLVHVKNQEHGVLGRINLGLTGINILDVLN